jgi:transcriptional regulator of met regulon
VCYLEEKMYVKLLSTQKTKRILKLRHSEMNRILCKATVHVAYRSHTNRKVVFANI